MMGPPLGLLQELDRGPRTVLQWALVLGKDLLRTARLTQPPLVLLENVTSLQSQDGTTVTLWPLQDTCPSMDENNWASQLGTNEEGQTLHGSEGENCWNICIPAEQ